MKILLAILLFAARSFAGDWSAEVIDKERDNLQIRVAVAFTDGKDRIIQTYRFDGPNVEALLKQQVADQLIKLKQLDEALQALPMGKVEIKPAEIVIPPTVEPPVKTQDDIDREAFLAALTLYRALTRAANAGVIDADDKRLVDTSAALKAAFKPEYLEMF